MKTTALFLVLSACLLQLGSATVTCDDATRAVCTKFQGNHGRVCGCLSTTSYDCTQNDYSYHGQCKGKKFKNLCGEFCSKGGHMCKGEVGGTCTQEE